MRGGGHVYGVGNFQMKTYQELTRESVAEAERRERLAEYAHQAWSTWMAYLFACGQETIVTVAGVEMKAWTMDHLAYERWQRQCHTRFNELSDSEKQSDYAEADKILAIVA